MVSHDLRHRCHATKRSYSGRHYYRPPKLGEGNVFTGVCLFTEGGWVSLVPGPFWGYPWYKVHSMEGLCPEGMYEGGYVQGGGSPQYGLEGVGTQTILYWHLVVATTHAVGKWVVRILLECTLVCVVVFLVPIKQPPTGRGGVQQITWRIRFLWPIIAQGIVLLNHNIWSCVITSLMAGY